MMGEGKKELVLTFTNTHQAIMAEKLLKSGGISLRVMALPAQIEAGCGLCIRIDPGDYTQGMAILKQGATLPQGAFIKTTQGGKTSYTPY